MAESQDNKLAKAELRKLDAAFKNEVEPEKTVIVQFNPETLKVSYANQIAQPDGGGDKRGSQSQLFVGEGTTKLSCQLWFDINAPQTTQPIPGWKDVDDVRKLTNRVSYFITPQQDKKDAKKFVPPAVRFIWGSFQFDGIIESLEESLEYFSPEGRPVRASVSIAMTQQKILVFPPGDLKSSKTPVGTQPTTPIPEGKSLQQVAGPNWQEQAKKDGISNPRHPQSGQRIGARR